MKFRSSYLAILFGALVLSGCGGDSLVTGSGDDTDTLVPNEQDDFVANGPRPPELAPVITTDSGNIYDVAGNPILLRGANLLYADDPSSQIDGVAAIAGIGSNAIGVQLTPNTTTDQLTNVLDEVVANDLVAVLSLYDEALVGSEDDTALLEAVYSTWLGSWLPVLAQEQYQSHIMINIASQWGPLDVRRENTIGYDDFIATYKVLIRNFREAGFNVPLVIDAPHLGQDFNGFLGARGRELLAADIETNIVLGVRAFDRQWNTGGEIEAAMNKLNVESVPVLVTAFGGSGVNDDDSVNHIELMTKALGDSVMTLDLPWETTEDRVGYVTDFTETQNFEGAAVTVDVFVPTSYINDGNLAFQIFLNDTEGRYAARGYQTVGDLRTNTWNTLSFDFENTEAFGFVSDGFDLTQIAQIGIEVAANGKPVDVDGDILIDNIVVGVRSSSSGSSSAVYSADFEQDETWVNVAGPGDTDVLTQETVDGNGVISLLAPWNADQSSSQIGWQGGNSLNPPIDLTEPLRVSVDIFVPAEYPDSANVQFFFNDANWSGFAGVGWRQFSGLTRDSWQTIEVTITDLAQDAGFISEAFVLDAPPPQFGVQVGALTTTHTAPIRFDNFSIEPIAGVAEVVTLYEANFDGAEEGWRVGFGAGADDENTVTQGTADGEGVLFINAPWTAETPDTTAVYPAAAALNPAIDITQPMRLSMELYVPSEYADENMAVQFYFNDNNFQGFAGFGYTNAFDYDAWNTISVSITDFEEGVVDPSNFDLERRPQWFGFQVAGITSPKTNSLRLRNFEITTTSALVPGDIVMNQGFDTQDAVDAFVLSYLGGAWTGSTVYGAKYFAYGFNPFGWLASVWTGAGAGQEALNISNSVDLITDLTARGQEIVETEGVGITATSVMASFE